MPESRRRLLPGVAAHADLLTTSFDLIDDPPREAGAKLAEWVVAHYNPGQPLDVTVICTGTSRLFLIGILISYRSRTSVVKIPFVSR